MKKILLIEDDQLFANVYRNRLLVEGFEVEVAGDGEAGLELTRSFRPDVILLDLILPKLPGVEFIKRIRLESEFQKLPLIVLTNTYLTSNVQDAWKAGATHCLTKANCTPKQVIRMIRKVLSGTTTAATPAEPIPNTLVNRTPLSSPSTPLETPPVSDDSEELFQAELRKSFIDEQPATLAALRSLLQALVKAENETARLQAAQPFYRRVRGLTGNAGIAGLFQIAQMAECLEALLKELHEKPKTINASTLRTVASSVDFLGFLFERSSLMADEPPRDSVVLVVDDEAISRRAITYSLEKAKLRSVNVEDPLQALQLVSSRPFDLIFLDVDMPIMNGYELCSKLRSLPACRTTPVVFVTNLYDFESRANSSMSGGNDFIAKPFLFVELAVKALLYVLRRQLETAQP